jgi:hypothetical protein
MSKAKPKRDYLTQVASSRDPLAIIFVMSFCSLYSTTSF